MQPVTATDSPVMTDRRLQWRYETFDVPLDRCAMPRELGATLNDGFLGGIAGGLRRYHQQHCAWSRGSA